MKKSRFEIGQQVFVDYPDGGIDIGVVTVIDNTKVQRNGKPAIKVKDAFNKSGFVKTKYLSKIKPKKNNE